MDSAIQSQLERRNAVVGCHQGPHRHRQPKATTTEIDARYSSVAAPSRPEPAFSIPSPTPADGDPGHGRGDQQWPECLRSIDGEHRCKSWGHRDRRPGRPPPRRRNGNRRTRSGTVINRYGCRCVFHTRSSAASSHLCSKARRSAALGSARFRAPGRSRTCRSERVVCARSAGDMGAVGGRRPRIAPLASSRRVGRAPRVVSRRVVDQCLKGNNSRTRSAVEGRGRHG